MRGTKEKFRKEFLEGTLYDLWKDVGVGFLAQWAGHRMAVALKAIDSIDLPRDVRALDIGIGSGSLIHELSDRGCIVFGADFSSSIIRMTRKRLGGGQGGSGDRIVLADIESLPMKNNVFHLVTCLGVFEYLSGDDRALNEIYRILRPGGHLVLAVASYHRIGNLTTLAFRKIVKNSHGPDGESDRGKNDGGHSGNHLLNSRVRMVKPVDIRRNAQGTGFEVKDFMCFGGKVFGRYVPLRISIPGVIYIGDHCLLVLKKPA